MRDTFSPRGPETGGAYPPPPQAYPPSPGAYERPQEPAPYAPPPAQQPGALAVMTPPERPTVTGGPPPTPERDPGARYRSDPQRQSPVWQAVKWPIRKLLLGIYYIVQAARRHKLFALVVVVALVALLGAGLAVRQLTQPPQVGVPTSVTHFFHGRQAGNAQEMYNSLDPNLQGSETQTLLQNIVSSDKSSSITITNYSQVDRHPIPGGGTYYLFRVDLAAPGQTGSQYYAFIVGSNGLIQDFGPMFGPA